MHLTLAYSYNQDSERLTAWACQLYAIRRTYRTSESRYYNALVGIEGKGSWLDIMFSFASGIEHSGAVSLYGIRSVSYSSLNFNIKAGLIYQTALLFMTIAIHEHRLSPLVLDVLYCCTASNRTLFLTVCHMPLYIEARSNKFVGLFR